MPSDAALLKRLAAALPDIPRWLEARSMLLAGACELFGLAETPDLSFIVRDPATRSIAVVGRPPPEALRQAASRNQNSGGVVSQLDNQEHVAAALPDWTASPATLHLLADTARLPAVPDGDVRLLMSSEIAALNLPPDLKSELEIAVLRSPVFATVVDGHPVSFCYAASVTETLWDVSIDTLEPYRRRGYAGLCVSYTVDHMYERRKRPVWGAEESNVPSLRLARRLGFKPVDRLVVFGPPTAGPRSPPGSRGT